MRSSDQLTSYLWKHLLFPTGLNMLSLFLRLHAEFEFWPPGRRHLPHCCHQRLCSCHAMGGCVDPDASGRKWSHLPCCSFLALLATKWSKVWIVLQLSMSKKPTFLDLLRTMSKNVTSTGHGNRVPSEIACQVMSSYVFECFWMCWVIFPCYHSPRLQLATSLPSGHLRPFCSAISVGLCWSKKRAFATPVMQLYINKHQQTLIKKHQQRQLLSVNSSASLFQISTGLG